MSDAVTGGLVTAASGVLITIVTTLGARRMARGAEVKDTANADLHEANAEQVRVDTAIKAADSIARLAQQNAALARQNQQQQGVIDRVVWSIELHGEWDRHVAEILNRLREALDAAGIRHDIPDVPPPPPLTVAHPVPDPRQS